MSFQRTLSGDLVRLDDSLVAIPRLFFFKEPFLGDSGLESFSSSDFKTVVTGAGGGRLVIEFDFKVVVLWLGLTLVVAWNDCVNFSLVASTLLSPF